MQSRFFRGTLLAALLVGVTLVPAEGSMVLKMDLADLALRADHVFRGTVLSVEPGTITAGGAELPTVTYRLQVGEAFKGDYSDTKGIAEITMVGSLKEDTSNGSIRRFSHLPGLPDLVRGGDYVVFTTPPSAIGLSTTVGLGQGAFKLYFTADRQEMAVNEVNNAGLTDTINGPVTYDTLADAIRQQLGQ